VDEKVRGKLISLGVPRMALVVRGHLDLESGVLEGKDGWTILIGRPSLKPIVEHSDDLDSLVKLLI
jgi:hypothetical protein